MTTFDKREENFEKKFALDEEQRFKVKARGHRLFGLWVAEQLGLAGDAAVTYAREVVAADFAGPGEPDVVGKVLADLTATGRAITEQQLRTKIEEFMIVALAQVKAGN